MNTQGVCKRRAACIGSNRQGRAGSAVVEFALVAPIFVLFVFGIIEFGRVMQVKNVITNASREAARAAVVDGATAGEAEQIAKDVAGIGTVPGVEVQITPSNLASVTPGEQIKVTVSIDFQDVSFLPIPAILKDLALSGSTCMQREGVE